MSVIEKESAISSFDADGPGIEPGARCSTESSSTFDGNVRSRNGEMSIAITKTKIVCF